MDEEIAGDSKRINLLFVMRKITSKQMIKAIKAIIFTEATFRYLAANDPQALKQLLQCITLGDLDEPQAAYIGRMRPLIIDRQAL